MAGRFIYRVLTGWMRERTWLFAAGVAFYAAISTLPVLLTGIFILGWFVGTGPAREMIIASVGKDFGPQGSAMVHHLLCCPHPLEHSGGILSTGIFLLSLLLGATRFGVALRYALDMVWKTPGKRGPRRTILVWFSTRIFSLLLIIGGNVVLFMLPLFSVVLEGVRKVFQVFLGPEMAPFILPPLLFAADTLGGGIIVSLLLWGIYCMIPKSPVTREEALAGALIGGSIFVLGKHGMAHMMHRSLFSSLYGMVGMFMLFLLWIYFIAQVVLFGAQCARVWGEMRRESRPWEGGMYDDTT